MKKISILIIAVLASMCLVAQDWTVNPQDYEFLMSVTGQVKLDGVISNQQNSKIGAFVNDQCRGVTTPIEVAGNNMYFLTIYSNLASGETVEFHFLDSLDQVTIFNSLMLFIPDRIIGIPDNPYLWMSPEEYASTDFLSYSVSGMIDDAEINTGTKEIHIMVDAETNISSLAASFELPVGAKAYVNDLLQESGTSQNNYSQLLNYTVHGVDGSTAVWSVYLSVFNAIENSQILQANVFPSILYDNYVTIETNQISNYLVIDNFGRILLEGTVNIGLNKINTSYFKPGLYILLINTPRSRKSFKIIVP
jgi:hypothetical protein